MYNEKNQTVIIYDAVCNDAYVFAAQLLLGTEQIPASTMR
jgi:hypothetical protein